MGQFLVDGVNRETESSLEPLEGKAALLTDFRPLTSRVVSNTFILFKTINVWQFITAVIGNKYTH